MMPTSAEIERAIGNAQRAGDQGAVEALTRALDRARGQEFSDRFLGEGGGERVDMQIPLAQRAEEQREREMPSRAASALYGFTQGATLNFGDEIAGGINAARDVLRGGGEFSDAYDRRVAQAREAMRAAEEANPGSSLAGNIGGAVVSALAAPARLGPVVGGMIYGTGAGVGAGEDVDDRLVGGAIGGATGAGLGYMTPKLIDGALALGRRAYNAVAPRVVSVFNPDEAAAMRVVDAIGEDALSGTTARLDDTQYQAAILDRQPTVLVDRGGQNTRSLMRSATNQSPDALQTVQDVVHPRFSMEGPRIRQFIGDMTGGTADNPLQLDILQAAARRANRHRYAAAYRSPNANAVWTPNLENLSQAPAVQLAIREATERGANKAAATGQTPVRNPFVFDAATERFVLRPRPNGSRAVPNLPFWDVVKQSLDDQYREAQRQGRSGEAQDILDLVNNLKDTLDTIVPEYAVARRGAAAAFGAEDALEAGQRFVGSRMQNPLAERQLQRMSAPERELFRTGYVNELMGRISEVRDRSQVTKALFGSPALRERHRIALGPEMAGKLEAFVARENIMDMARQALGNSTSARQLVELGLVGAGGGASYLSQDPTALMGSLLLIGARRGSAAVSARVADRVARLLMSDDPQAFARAARMIARNQNIRAALQGVETNLAGILANTGGGTSARLLSGPVSALSDDQPQPEE